MRMWIERNPDTGVVVSLWPHGDEATDKTPADCFTPEIASRFHERIGDEDIGWVWNGKAYDPPVEHVLALPVPPEISRRQFFQQLAIGGDITQDEALSAVTSGTLPEKLANAIASLPKDQQFTARMLICGAASFARMHPMVGVLGKALRKDDAALDALWTKAVSL